MKYTLSLHTLKKEDQVIAGNKAVILGEFTQGGHSFFIPNGFVIPAYTFDSVLIENSVYSAIFRRIFSTDFEDYQDVERTARFAQNKIKKLTVPEPMLLEIASASMKLKCRRFAVRSSAVVEDGISSSYAGQFESVLGVTINELEQAIKKVWASAFSVRVLMYRKAQARIYDPYGMGVIVQEMVPAQVSGVGFSIHPDPIYADMHVIETVPGLGTTLVSGKETPDQYFIENSSNLLVDALIARQKKKEVLSKGKVAVKSLSKSQGTNRLLEKKDAEFISKQLGYLEKHLAVPVDIEWAKYRGEIMLLQVRPITYQTTWRSSPTHKQLWHKSTQAFLVTEVWSESEKNAKSFLGFNTQADALFVHNPSGGVAVYYHREDLRNKPLLLLEFYKNNAAIFNRSYCYYMNLVGEMQQEDFMTRSLSEILHKLEEIWPFMSVLYILLDLRERSIKIPKFIEEKLIQARVVGEKVSHTIFSKVLTKLEKPYGVPRGTFYYSDFLTKREILEQLPVSKSELRRRSRRSFVYYRDNIFTGPDARQLLKEKIIISNKNNSLNKNDLSGKRIYPGQMSGLVYVSKGLYDMTQLPAKHVLVVKSLSPEYASRLPDQLPGILVEEGGEFSHGAILARERKIPCVVGVKNITKTVKNGDLIEVRSNSGVVRRLSND